MSIVYKQSLMTGDLQGPNGTVFQIEIVEQIEPIHSWQGRIWVDGSPKYFTNIIQRDIHTKKVEANSERFKVVICEDGITAKGIYDKARGLSKTFTIGAFGSSTLTVVYSPKVNPPYTPGEEFWADIMHDSVVKIYDTENF